MTNPDTPDADAGPAPTAKRQGDDVDAGALLAALRQANQRALGPSHDAAGLARHGAEGCARVRRLERGLVLSECLRAFMERRTESRGTHYRADYPIEDAAWRRKQAAGLGADGGLVFEDLA